METMGQTPHDFLENSIYEGHSISYGNMSQMGSGGPSFGDLSIDGRVVSAGAKSGGPWLGHEKHIFVPILKKHTIAYRFSILRINLPTRQVLDFNLVESIIFLDRVDSAKLIYFEYFEKSGVEKTISI